ncbi:putative pentatricopeptide repeat-containing protein [Platanthera zijinensis]|uniref:Pentatricopeptide repeat-containing protein n=1 Tax=Platanthera zijinensis TaxID=2320716 RepID=A0AAP0BJW0_9ASPA
MSNIYAEAGRWHGVEDLRTAMMGCGIPKQPGCTQIELNLLHSRQPGSRHPGGGGGVR